MQKPRFATSAAITAAVILGLAGTGASALYAATSTSGDNPAKTLVTAIAKKFNLKESDVQQVFDDQRAAMKANHDQKDLERLASAVKAGTITQAQADAITVKEKEMKAAMDALKDKTPQERQAAIKIQMDALKQWATNNKIPREFFPFGGPRMGHGHQGFRGASGHNEREMPRELRVTPKAQ